MKASEILQVFTDPILIVSFLAPSISCAGNGFRRGRPRREPPGGPRGPASEGAEATHGRGGVAYSKVWRPDLFQDLGLLRPVIRG